jgi:hypothetical protein
VTGERRAGRIGSGRPRLSLIVPLKLEAPVVPNATGLPDGPTPVQSPAPVRG